MNTKRVKGMPPFAVICPECGTVAQFSHEKDWGDDEFNPSYNDFWHCEECDWQQDLEEEDCVREISEPLRNAISTAANRLTTVWETYQNTYHPLSLDDMNIPFEDFEWKDHEGGDWHVYCCGEKDCEQQWHKVRYLTSYERKDGVLTITRESADEDGDGDVIDEWNSDEDGPWGESDMGREWGKELDEYFHGWAEYWLACAENLNDPLGDAHDAPETRTYEGWVEFCLNAALDNIRAIERGVRATMNQP